MAEKARCDICGKSFNSEKQLKQHKHDVHDNAYDKATKSHHNKSSKVSKKLMIVIGIGVLIALVVGIGVYSVIRPITSSASSPTIDGIQCNTMEQANFHIHAHLDIFINGKHYIVPSQIGIKPDDRCLYWLHTHDNSGIIHVESPERRDFTLGQFFDIWNKTFNNRGIFNYTASGDNNTLSVYVDGHKVNGMNYRDIKLNAHDEIAIVYGKPPLTIPSKYAFQEGL